MRACGSYSLLGTTPESHGYFSTRGSSDRRGGAGWRQETAAIAAETTAEEAIAVTVTAKTAAEETVADTIEVTTADPVH